MTKYIGMDAHSSTCSLCVVDSEGSEIKRAQIVTNGKLLVEHLRSIEGRKELVFEECELSAWLYEVLAREVDKLVVCNPARNAQYKRAKTDKLDAENLAQLLRGGFLTPVYHDGSKREQLRALVSGYQDIVDLGVRVKNRYKLLFRKSGLRFTGTKLYGDESFLEDLPRADLRFIGQGFYRLLEVLEVLRKGYAAEISKAGRRFEEIKLLKTIPGIGELHAAKILAQVVSAERFKDKHKFYSYCGLVRHQVESGERSYGSRRGYGNRILKCVYKMAGYSALSGTSGLRKYYDAQREAGKGHKPAYNAVCRKIAGISLSLLKHKRSYDDKMVKWTAAEGV